MLHSGIGSLLEKNGYTSEAAYLSRRVHNRRIEAENLKESAHETRLSLRSASFTHWTPICFVISVVVIVYCQIDAVGRVFVRHPRSSAGERDRVHRNGRFIAFRFRRLPQNERRAREKHELPAATAGVALVVQHLH